MGTATDHGHRTAVQKRSIDAERSAIPLVVPPRRPSPRRAPSRLIEPAGGYTALSLKRVLAALVATLALGAAIGCGEAEPPTVRPSAADRSTPRQLGDLLAVELVRARLVAASDLYLLGQRADARFHLAAARQGYAPLAPHVRAKVPRLGREIDFAFALLTRWMAAGEDPQRVRERIAPVSDQLMEGAQEALLPTAVRLDPAVQAAVVRPLLEQLEVSYRRAAPPPDDASARRSMQRAYGLLSRAQHGVVEIEETLRTELPQISTPLSILRFEAFSGGLGPLPPPVEGEPIPPPQPPPGARATGLVTDARRALDRWFAP